MGSSEFEDDAPSAGDPSARPGPSGLKTASTILMLVGGTIFAASAAAWIGIQSGVVPMFDYLYVAVPSVIVYFIGRFLSMLNRHLEKTPDEEVRVKRGVPGGTRDD